MRFLDTNVLIYAFATDERAEPARVLVAGGGIITIQSLNEFTDVSRRKLKKDWAEIEADIQVLLESCTMFDQVTAEAHAQARKVAERHQLRIFDAMLVAVALAAGCDELISEDLHEGMVFDGRLRVSNPFA
jgi:predicted nucleic acid-binding protein